ncbi:hypothetical protein QUA70_08885 [Microcoleus sp. LAD1_D5]
MQFANNIFRNWEAQILQIWQVKIRYLLKVLVLLNKSGQITPSN